MFHYLKSQLKSVHQSVTDKIAILLPTRNRPKMLARFWESVVKTAEDINNVSMYLYLDDDDHKGIDGAQELNKQYPENVFYLIGPRILMSQMPNELLKITNDEGIIFLAGDDLIMRTDSWDTIVVEAFEGIDDRIALFYGVDGAESQHPPDFATHPIIHRKWFDVLGYINPPYFSCDYADTWLNSLADAVCRKFLLPIFNEHMHFTVGKSEFDSTYLEARQRFAKDNVPQQFMALAKTRDEDIQKLKEYIKSNEV